LLNESENRIENQVQGGVTMKRLKALIRVLVVLGVMVSLCSPASAEYYNICGKDLAVEGFIRQEFAFGTSDSNRLKTNQSGLHSAYQMWYLDTNLELTSDLEVRGILRLWGDLAYQMLSDNSHFERYFKSSKKNLNWDDNFDQILREFYVSYYSSKFMVRIGKQQVGWGQADGLRLIDVINPLDIRRGPFYDTEGYEEMRIPKWMIKTEFYPGNIGPLLDMGVEFYWNPGDVKETGELLPSYVNAQLGGGTGLFNPISPTPIYGDGVPVGMQRQWGIWGVPVNFVPLPIRMFKKERATAIKNSEFGARIKFSFKNTFITLNYWQGFQPDMVLKFRGIVPDAFGGFFPPLGVLQPSVILMDRVYRRMRVAGFTLNRELFGVGKLACQVANPVLRVEGLYDFKHPFNTGLMTATDMLVIQDYDQIRYMVGFDWSMKIPLLNRRKSTFVSGQMFHFHTLNYRGGANAPRPAPFYTWTYPKNQFYTTLLVRTEYMNERIIPSILYAHDYNNQSAWIKSKVDFRIGDHWRPQIGYLWIRKNTHHTQNPGFPFPIAVSDNWKSFGAFEDRDEVWIRIQYQF